MLRLTMIAAFLGVALAMSEDENHGNNPGRQAIIYNNPDDRIAPTVEYGLNVLYAATNDIQETIHIAFESGLLPFDMGNLGEECVTRAKDACGQGNICWICICENGAYRSCQFECRANDGSCNPAPPCCPQSDPKYISFTDG